MLKNRSLVDMLLLLILWGSFAAVSKLSLYGADNWQMLFYMFGSAWIFMTIAMVWNGKIAELRHLSRKDLYRLILYGLPSFFYYFLYTMALNKIPAVEASMLNYLFPVMIVIFAVPINGEKINAAKLLSILLGFAGTLVILTNGHPASMKFSNVAGDVLAIAAAALWGFFSNLGKRNRIDSSLSNYVFVTVSFALSSVFIFVFSSFAIAPGALAGLLWLGISNVAVTYLIWFRVLKSMPTMLVSGLTFMTPFMNLVFIMLLLGEKISFAQFAGLFVIVLSIAIPSLKVRLATLRRAQINCPTK